MTTLNPLFLDSTKPIGDKVVTSVELLYVLLHDGDSLYFEVEDQFGFSQRFAMKTTETKKSVKYTAEIWLKYQHEIRYRFLIVAAGEEIFTSKFRQTHAGHVIADKWEPCFETHAASTKTEKRSARRAPAREAKVMAHKPLCQPQFFDQIKSLLDDLL